MCECFGINLTQINKDVFIDIIFKDKKCALKHLEKLNNDFLYKLPELSDEYFYYANIKIDKNPPLDLTANEESAIFAYFKILNSRKKVSKLFLFERRYGMNFKKLVLSDGVNYGWDKALEGGHKKKFGHLNKDILDKKRKEFREKQEKEKKYELPIEPPPPTAPFIDNNVDFLFSLAKSPKSKFNQELNKKIDEANKFIRDEREKERRRGNSLRLTRDIDIGIWGRSFDEYRPKYVYFGIKITPMPNKNWILECDIDIATDFKKGKIYHGDGVFTFENSKKLIFFQGNYKSRRTKLVGDLGKITGKASLNSVLTWGIAPFGAQAKDLNFDLKKQEVKYQNIKKNTKTFYTDNEIKLNINILSLGLIGNKEIEMGERIDW